MASCSVITIFISLVTVHFYRLVLNYILGSLWFVFFGDMVEILLFIIFIMMCPGVPDPRCGSGARAYFLSGMALVAKVEAKKLIY